MLIRKKKIGIDMRLIGKKQTGSEAVFFNLAKHLACLDQENEYYLFINQENQSFIDKLRLDLGIRDKNNFQVISLPTKNKFVWNFWTLPRHLRENPVDIYLTQYITPFFVSSKIKIITIIHDVSFRVFPKLIRWTDRFFLNLLIPISLKRADKILAVSQFTRSEIIRYYNINSEKVDWIHNAIAENFGAEISTEKLIRVREKYKLPKKFILYLGTMQPRKNIPALIEAYDSIREKTAEIDLVLAGGKGYNYDQKIEELIEKKFLKDKVIFPGFVDEEDKSAIMKLAWVFCFPSRYEGFGIPILESMSLGVPVIASSIAPHQEITQGSALLFEIDNKEDFSKKLQEIILDADLRKKIIEDELRQAQKFSWTNTAKKMLEIYANM